MTRSLPLTASTLRTTKEDMMGLFNRKDNEPEEPKLADRQGEFVLPLTDRRRLAVSHIIMLSEANNGMLMPMFLKDAIIANAIYLDVADLQALTGSVMERLAKIANGGGY